MRGGRMPGKKWENISPQLLFKIPQRGCRDPFHKMGHLKTSSQKKNQALAASRKKGVLVWYRNFPPGGGGSRQPPFPQEPGSVLAALFSKTPTDPSSMGFEVHTTLCVHMRMIVCIKRVCESVITQHSVLRFPTQEMASASILRCSFR